MTAIRGVSVSKCGGATLQTPFGVIRGGQSAGVVAAQKAKAVPKDGPATQPPKQVGGIMCESVAEKTCSRAGVERRISNTTEYG